VLPKYLVHTYMGRRFVKVLDNDLVTERDVETGIETSTHYELIGGLEPGEHVVR
jgi:hypothetical protein